MRYIWTITLFIWAMSCQKRNTEVAENSRTAISGSTEVESNSDLPPFELLQSNYAAASHVAVLKVKRAKIAERTHADNKALGYVVYEIAGDMVQAYKGNFDQNSEVVCYHFLEYSPKLQGTRFDTVLVFMNKDPDSNKFSVIEVGRFKLQEGLTEMIEAISQQRDFQAQEK